MEITGLTILPLYLSLVAVTRKNCVGIPAKETEITKACKELGESLKEYRSYLVTLEDILPTVDQLAELQAAPWIFPDSTSITEESRTLLETFVRTFASGTQALQGDEVRDSMFSADRMKYYKGIIDKKQIPELDNFHLAEFHISNLIQTRLSREEAKEAYRWIFTLLVGGLLPQILLLLFILMQFLALKRRERQAKRRMERSLKDRELLARLMTARRADVAQDPQPLE